MREQKATRDAFGEALLEIGRKNKKVVVVSGDLEDATRAEYFKKEFPDRFFNLGIAEQDILGTAVGLSLDGLIPVATSFAVFLTNRAYGILRISICYNKRNVKIVGSHAGLTVGADGATAQCLEDFAITRVLPNLVVLAPADAIETKKAFNAMINYRGPVYMRVCRAATPIITKESDHFEIGKALVLRNGKDVTIIACGIMVAKALDAADELADKGIQAEIINMHTIKPLDAKAIISSAQSTGAVVTAEEHQINGGLGSAVSEVLSINNPVPMAMVAVNDTFGESGPPDALLEKYGLTKQNIVNAVHTVIKKKKAAVKIRG